jgi:2,3-bisphosphoglycerate-independent phosphoglycerate mutase
MSMAQVGEKVIEAMTGKERDYPFIMCNLAAPDMVGHTGVYQATIVACEVCCLYAVFFDTMSILHRF